MSNLTRILRWAALPLALSMTATLAQATILYAGDPTPLGTLSATTPTLFEDAVISPLGVTFNDYWTFTLPSGSTGGGGGVGGANVYFTLHPLGFSTTPLDLTVSIGGVTVTGSSDHFSFTGTPGTPYTLDISGTTDASAVGASYIGAIQAVPEPATWALMLAGIAVGAGVARRRLS